MGYIQPDTKHSTKDTKNCISTPLTKSETNSYRSILIAPNANSTGSPFTTASRETNWKAPGVEEIGLLKGQQSGWFGQSRISQKYKN